MLTPVFELNQDEEFILLQIEAPYVKANEVEIYIEGSEFKFYVKPYFLRLHFPSDLIEDGREYAQYDISTGIFNIKLPKKNKGELFPNLDMLTTLLASKKSSVNKPLIEIVTEHKDEGAGGLLQTESCEEEDSDEECWQFEQELYNPEISLSGYKYGFGNQSSGIFTRLQEEEIVEIIDLPDPENTSPQDRRTSRLKLEDEKFDKEHYIADYLDDSVIKDLMNYKAPWDKEYEAILLNHQKLYPETSNLITPKGNTKHFQESVVVSFTEEEKKRLLQLPNKEYLLSKAEQHAVFLGLVDIMFAYSYNHRTTEGENTSESAWTITKLSSTISWFDTMKSTHDAVHSCMRRCLCYPLYRHWHLINLVLRDVQTIFSLGKRWILRCLLEIYEVLEKDENKHILNKLYIMDYCVWIQKVKSKKLLSLANQLKCVEITKNDTKFELVSIEQEAMSVVNSLDWNVDSSVESESSEDDSLDSSDSSTDSDDAVGSSVRTNVGSVNEKRLPYEHDIEVLSTGLEELLSINKLVQSANGEESQD